MPASFRLIGLVALARLISAGWTPWLLLVGWLLIASFQEPLLFRGYGIHLVNDAAWTGCLVVLLVLLGSLAQPPRRCATSANLTILCGMAVLQAVGGYLADQGSNSVDLTTRVAGASFFFLAWAPLTITLGRKIGVTPASRLLGMMVVLAAGLLGSMLAVALRASPDTFVVMASALAIAGAASWAFGRRGNT